MPGKPVAFERPPVIEVVFGVAFPPIEGFCIPHIGAFWQEICDEYPRVEEAPWVPPSATMMSGAISWGPDVGPVPLPRSWLLAPDGSGLIQMQRDRFLFNWKKPDQSAPYPSYKALRPQFESHLTRFQSFLKRAKLGAIQVAEYELTYVNHIGVQEGLDGIGERGLLRDHVRANKSRRFLPDPTSMALRTSYPLPRGAGTLTVAAQVGRSQPQSEPILRLDLTARGGGPSPGKRVRTSWFELAHEWITRGFVDATSAEAQVKWGLIR